MSTLPLGKFSYQTQMASARPLTPDLTGSAALGLGEAGLRLRESRFPPSAAAACSTWGQCLLWPHKEAPLS